MIFKSLRTAVLLKPEATTWLLQHASESGSKPVLEVKLFHGCVIILPPATLFFLTASFPSLFKQTLDFVTGGK